MDVISPAATQLASMIAESQCEDKHAFFRLFNHCNNKLFHYVLPRVGNRDDAMDVVQEVFIDLWNSLKKFTYHSDEEFYGFLFLIAKRRLAKYYRSKKTTIELTEECVTQNYEIVFEDYRYLEKHVNELSEDDAELIRLRYWSRLSFGEIGGVLGITENNAKVRHHRALERLKGIVHAI